MSGPLAVHRWADLDAAGRAAILERGLGDVFDPALGAAIAELDPAANGAMQAELAALHPPTDVDPAERAAQAVLETAGWP